MKKTVLIFMAAVVAAGAFGDGVDVVDSLLTTIAETSKSRDEYKIKYEAEHQKALEAQVSIQKEMETYKKDKDNAVILGLSVGAIGVPLGCFIGGVASTGDTLRASGASLLAVAIEGGMFGLYKLGEYCMTLYNEQKK